ncbi:MAG: hypothetical protein ABEI54_00210, partial [Candidatus Bipolaricaulia bacterium]
KADTIRGEGEAKALDIYSTAYSKDEEFYKFWRKLESYRRSFGQGDGKNTILISPDSRYLQLLASGKSELSQTEESGQTGSAEAKEEENKETSDQ